MGGISFLSLAKAYYRGATKYGRAYFDNYAQHGMPHLIKYDPVLTGERVDGIIDHLCLKKGESIMDFGCGKGFYVKTFRDKGMKAFGFDVGLYPFVSAGKLVGTQYIYARPIKLSRFVSAHGKFDLVIAKDILEHIPPHEVTGTVSFLSTLGKKMLVVVPVSAKKGQSQTLVFDDPTHLTALDDLEWGGMLSRFGLVREDEGLNEILKKNKSGANCSFIVDIFD